MIQATWTEQPTPYPDLNAVLADLDSSLGKLLSDKFIGLYLQGSFAVGDFDVHSDVDFLVILSEKLSEPEVTALQLLHKRIYGLPCLWAQHLEGSYFPLSVLQDVSRLETELWYLDNGSDHLEQSKHCNSLLVRHVLRENGIAVSGPASSTLLAPVPVEALKHEIYTVLQDWGNQILTHPEQYSNRFYQGFIVLNYCRMLHDYIEGKPSSKKAGANWAKASLDPAWQGLIDRAWATRPVPEVAVRTPADPVDFALTLQFVRYILDLSQGVTP